jgi:dihydropteroate synthase type 2
VFPASGQVVVRVGNECRSTGTGSSTWEYTWTELWVGFQPDLTASCTITSYGAGCAGAQAAGNHVVVGNTLSLPLLNGCSLPCNGETLAVTTADAAGNATANWAIPATALGTTHVRSCRSPTRADRWSSARPTACASPARPDASAGPPATRRPRLASSARSSNQARAMAGTFGIVNVTRDSFSDGGQYLAADAAVAHAERLLGGGADVIDLGAESTAPDGEDVPAGVEIERLRPVAAALLRRGAVISVDTRKPEVMRAMLALGVHWLNDVAGFRSDEAMAAVRAAPRHVRFVAMFSRTATGRADRTERDDATLLAELRAFFAERERTFAAAGIARERLVLDPGMGLFLSNRAAGSFAVLKEIASLRRDHGPLLVCVSRKGFLRDVTGASVAERGPASLAAELWAARAGVDWIRTHDVQALRMAWAVERAIVEAT